MSRKEQNLHITAPKYLLPYLHKPSPRTPKIMLIMTVMHGFNSIFLSTANNC